MVATYNFGSVYITKLLHYTVRMKNHLCCIGIKLSFLCMFRRNMYLES